MREYGIAIALEDDPINTPRSAAQSHKTIIGELIYLLEICEMQGDNQGYRYVALAIDHPLNNNKDQLNQFSTMRFIATSYKNYL